MAELSQQDQKTGLLPGGYWNPEFPYVVRPSLAPFLRYLRTWRTTADESGRLLADRLLNYVADHPELESAVEDPEVLASHQDLLADIMSGFFPAFSGQAPLGFVIVPFKSTYLYVTPTARQLVNSEQPISKMNMGEKTMKSRLVIHAAALILNKLYHEPFSFSIPTIVTVQHPELGIETHFQFNLNPDFVEARVTGPLPSLDRNVINRLLREEDDPEPWLEALPPEQFEIEGLTFVYLTEITEQEVLHRMKTHLLGWEYDPSSDPRSFLLTQLRSYFRQPGICAGVVGLDQSVAQYQGLVAEFSLSLLGENWPALVRDRGEGSVYQRAIAEGEPIVVPDLRDWPQPGPAELCLLDQGFRSLILIPVRNDEGIVVGLLELGAPQPLAFQQSSVAKAREIWPIISAGINRKREVIENQIRNLIQRKFTNIHPSVWWRFREAAIHMLRQQRKPEATPLPGIAFQQVFPFYGQADIVASSVQRNEAIRADLVENLQLARKLMAILQTKMTSYLGDYLAGKIDDLLSELQTQFSSNDESRVMDLLLHELHPFLRQLHMDYEGGVEQFLPEYFAQLDPDMDFVYRQRKAFEESVQELDRVLSQSLEQAQRHLQEALPHYFEKYSTDGVEYTLYLGQSLLNDRTFTTAHLQEFRLWQLVHMCELTREVAALRSRLPLPLTTAQLIFVYSDPLDIRFRADEKQFDVDGAYNVRYEIIKKRVDKAYIAGTEERLTQSGKIAIVYLHPRDREEYLDYLSYLQRRGYIASEIEDLSLAPLQGVEGLRALRVTVRG